jgi:signal transduction histidine kinase
MSNASHRDSLVQSSRIAASLLKILGETGDMGRRARGLRAVGGEAGSLHRAGRWLPTERLADMLKSVEVDRRLAQRVGQALVTADGVGGALCYSGLATPEKAYRRAHSLLAREAESARYVPQPIEGQCGLIHFFPPEAGAAERLPDELGEVLCGMREGMLETVPMLFGLVPARVRETACGYRGAPHCVFELSWTRSLRRGMWLGIALGALLGGGLAAASVWTGWPLALAAAGGVIVAGLAAAAGRSLDLAKQLDAVAGARLGHLALLDQLDTSLAERMDELAKAGGPVDAATARQPQPGPSIEGLVPVQRADRGGPAGTGESADEAAELAEVAGGVVDGIREAVVALRQQLGALHERLGVGAEDASEPGEGSADSTAPDSESLVRDCASQGRRIEALAAELDRRLHVGGDRREDVDMGALVQRSLAGLRAELPGQVGVAVELTGAVEAVNGDPFQLEYVIEQLVRNAVEVTAPGGGQVLVALAQTPAGVELSVQDQGGGIEASAVDEAFDPFFEEGPAGQSGGLGLPVCYRIVEEHGGELQMQSAEDQGTRVSVLLPPVSAGA